MILFPTSLRKMFSLSNVIFPAVTFLHLKKKKIKKLLSSSCSPWCVYFSSSSTEDELACLVWRITPPLMFMTLPLLSHAFLSQWLPSLWSLPLHWYFILCLQIFSNTLSMHESKMILKNTLRENEVSYLLTFLGIGTNGIEDVVEVLNNKGCVTEARGEPSLPQGFLGKDYWNVGHDASWSHTF